MSKSCTLCAILNGELDPNDVTLEYLHASSARMMTHFVMHPSIDLAHSIAKLFTFIGNHVELDANAQGARHYTDIANAWGEIIDFVQTRQAAKRVPARPLH
ncbi:MAG: hypothetical protein QM756_29840 [Polyangiaceae bacterium]